MSIAFEFPTLPIAVVPGDTWEAELDCYRRSGDPLALDGAIVTLSIHPLDDPTPLLTIPGIPGPGSDPAIVSRARFTIPKEDTATLDASARYEYLVRYAMGAVEEYIIGGRLYPHRLP